MPEEIIETNAEQNTVEIEETWQTEETQLDIGSIKESLSVEEFELAKTHGLIPEESEDSKDSSDEDDNNDKEIIAEETDGKKEEVEDFIDKDPDNFEAMDKVIEKDEKKFHEIYTPNQKALYFKSKANNKKRQDAIKELNETKSRLEEAIKGSKGQAKLDKIADILANKSDELTIEMLQSIINEKEAQIEPSKVEEEAQVNLVREKVAQKNKYAEQIGTAQHKNFIEIAKLANDLYQQDRPGGVYRSAIDSAYSDEVDESGLVNTIIQVAKFHPQFNEISEKVDNDKKNKVDRVIKNSKKKVSSASVGSHGKRIISEDDITAEQAVRLLETNPKKYHALSQKTKDRLLRQS